MADDKTKVRRADRDRINVNEPYELRYWFWGHACAAEASRRQGRADGGQNRQVPEEPITLEFGSSGRAPWRRDL